VPVASAHSRYFLNCGRTDAVDDTLDAHSRPLPRFLLRADEAIT
jgi:hypothetical protein